MSTFVDGTTLSPVTQSGLGDGIKSAFVDLLSYTAVDDYTASNIRNLVFTHVSDASKTYGLVFWRITISTAFAVSQSFGTAYNSGTKALANTGSIGASITFAATSPISFKAIHDPDNEIDWVVVYQGQSSLILGWINPITTNEVDKNFYCTYVHPFSMTTRTWRGVGTSASLRGVTSWNTWGGDIATINHVSKYDLFPRFALYDVGGAFGITSDKLAFGAGNGIGLFASVDDYQKVWNGGSTNSSWYVK